MVSKANSAYSWNRYIICISKGVKCLLPIPVSLLTFLSVFFSSPGSAVQICLLQETVRRECEERAELTAALSLAREQLLAVRQAAVNSSIPHNSASSSLPSLSAGLSRDGVTRGRSSASWHGNSHQPLPTLPRLTAERPAPLAETRLRLSTVTGRKDKRLY